MKDFEFKSGKYTGRMTFDAARNFYAKGINPRPDERRKMGIFYGDAVVHRFSFWAHSTGLSLDAMKPGVIVNDDTFKILEAARKYVEDSKVDRYEVDAGYFEPDWAARRVYYVLKDGGHRREVGTLHYDSDDQFPFVDLEQFSKSLVFDHTDFAALGLLMEDAKTKLERLVDA